MLNKLQRPKLIFQGDVVMRTFTFQAPKGDILVGLICLILFLSLFCSPPAAQQQPIRIGVPSRATLGNDPEPFIKVLNATIGGYIGIRLKREIQFEAIESLAELRRRFQERSLDVGLFWNELEYLVMRRQLSVIPMVSSYYEIQKGPKIEKVVVVRKDSGIRSLAELKGKKLVYHRREGGQSWKSPLTRADIHLIALQLYLVEQGYEWATFFDEQSIEIKRNLNPKPPSSAILSVLHRTGDVTVVNDLDFKLTVEKVPLVQKELMLLPIPNPVQTLFGAMFCRSDLDKILRQKAIDILTKMHEDTIGRKILSLIPVDRLAAVTDANYEAVRTFETRLKKAGILKESNRKER